MTEPTAETAFNNTSPASPEGHDTIPSTSPPAAHPYLRGDGGKQIVQTVSIVIPVYNEEATVATLVDLVVNAHIPGGLKRQIICVNDASRDNTASVLDALPGNYADREDVEFIVRHQPENRGKGAALRTGFGLATGDIVLVQDADLEYDPADYVKLIQPILDDVADVVFGSRFIGEPHRVLYFWHSVGNRVLTMLSNMFTNLNLTDMEVCYKVFRKSILDSIDLKCNRFGFEPEITAKVAKFRPRLRIYEVGIAYYGRSYEEGKKITWKDGVKAILAIVRFRFTD